MTGREPYVSVTALAHRDDAIITYVKPDGDVAIQIGTTVYIALDPADARALIDQLEASLRELAEREPSTLAAQADPDWDADATEPDSGVEAPE